METSWYDGLGMEAERSSVDDAGNSWAVQ